MNGKRIATNKRNLIAALFVAPLAQESELMNIEAESINSVLKERSLKMQRIVSRIIIATLALFTFSISASASEAEANAYGLGVSIGIASFQASQAQEDNSLDIALLVRDELGQAIKFAYPVKKTVPNLDVNQLTQMYNLLNYPFEAYNRPLGRVQQVSAQLLTARGSYLTTIRKVSPRASSAFELSLDMAIAEGQATAGEAARGIVRSSLVNARSPAIALGVPRYELNKIIAQIDQGAAIADIYNQVAYLRGKYQGML